MNNLIYLVTITGFVILYCTKIHTHAQFVQYEKQKQKQKRTSQI